MRARQRSLRRLHDVLQGSSCHRDRERAQPHFQDQMLTSITRLLGTTDICNLLGSRDQRLAISFQSCSRQRSGCRSHAHTLTVDDRLVQERTHVDASDKSNMSACQPCLREFHRALHLQSHVSPPRKSGCCKACRHQAWGAVRTTEGLDKHRKCLADCAGCGDSRPSSKVACSVWPEERPVGRPRGRQALCSFL